MVRYKNIIHREPRVVIVDSNFFSFFSYKLLKGSTANVLTEPNTIALSASAARKYFGSEEPLGKVLDISTQKVEYHCVVTGVFEDFPVQSHLHLDMMISFSSTQQWLRDTWYMHEAYTYVKINDPSGVRNVEQKFPALAEKYKTADAMRDKMWGVHLVPLTSIHLNAFKPYERETKGSRRTINFITVIAWIVLIVGWVNFINILVSKAMERTGEISVRKITGASTIDIIKQFMVESVMINLLALLFFFTLMFLIKLFMETVYTDTLINHFWQRPLVWELIGFTFIAGTVMASTIPIWILNDSNSSGSLKNSIAFRSGTGKTSRLMMIVFQYFAALVLIIATVTIHSKLAYMRSMDLGIGIDQTFVFKTPARSDNYEEKIATLMQSLRSISGVQAVTASSSIPGRANAFVMANQRGQRPPKGFKAL